MKNLLCSVGRHKWWAREVRLANHVRNEELGAFAIWGYRVCERCDYEEVRESEGMTWIDPGTQIMRDRWAEIQQVIGYGREARKRDMR